LFSQYFRKCKNGVLRSYIWLSMFCKYFWRKRKYKKWITCRNFLKYGENKESHMFTIDNTNLTIKRRACNWGSLLYSQRWWVHDIWYFRNTLRLACFQLRYDYHFYHHHHFRKITTNDDFFVSKNPPRWPTNKFFLKPSDIYTMYIHFLCRNLHHCINQMCTTISFHSLLYITLHYSTFCVMIFIYYNITFQFALRRCLELPFKPAFCSNWPILCYHHLRLETCFMERV